MKSVTYVGAADTPLDYYHGRAKLASGDSAAAMELLAAGAIMAKALLADDKVTVRAAGAASVNTVK